MPLRIVADASALADTAAHAVVEVGRAALAERGRFLDRVVGRIDSPRDARAPGAAAAQGHAELDEGRFLLERRTQRAARVARLELRHGTRDAVEPARH